MSGVLIALATTSQSCEGIVSDVTSSGLIVAPYRALRFVEGDDDEKELKFAFKRPGRHDDGCGGVVVDGLMVEGVVWVEYRKGKLNGSNSLC